MYNDGCSMQEVSQMSWSLAPIGGGIFPKLQYFQSRGVNACRASFMVSCTLVSREVKDRLPCHICP